MVDAVSERQSAERIVAAMAQLRLIGKRRVLDGLVTLGFVSWFLSRSRRRRPSAATLMAMGNEEFAAFLRSRGLKTASEYSNSGQHR